MKLEIIAEVKLAFEQRSLTSEANIDFLVVRSEIERQEDEQALHLQA